MQVRCHRVRSRAAVLMLAVLLTACSGPEGGALPSATQTVIPATATVTAAPPPTRAPTVTPAPAPPPTATATPTARPSATPRTGEIATSVTPRATTARPTPAPTRTPPPVASPATLTTEGVQRTGAAAWHEAGWTGKGVRVGVIDTTFNDYTKYLTGKVTARSFRADGLIEDPEDEEGRHGTACAEIVRAMAPDAELLLAAAGNGSRSFRAAVEWLVETEHVPIISLSYGPTGYPIDDTSVYAQIVDRARDAGTLFIVAAGNDGAGGIGSRTWQGHYGATYADADKDGAHDFVPPDAKSPANGVQVRVRSEPVEIVLNWDDWVQPQVNMSLALYDAAGTEVARADTPLSRRNTEPVQYLQGKFAPGTYTLRVRKRDAADPDLAFDIHFLGAQFAQTTPERSIEVPADARGALAVGESDWETDRVYPTSGRGPTRDGRAKPELVAPACVTSATFDGDEFCGTSAAAPHVAGAAALIRQAMPAATANDLLAFLTQHAAPLTGPDADPNTGGAGRLALGLPPPKP